MVEHSVEGEASSYCPEIFDMLSDLELQPGDGYGYPANILPENELLDASLLGHRESNKHISSQDDTQDDIDHLRQKTQNQHRAKRCSERRRRNRINAKLSSLRQLLPNSYKKDQVSILEEAIKYIQSLKLQRDVVLKSSAQNQLQAMFLPQTHVSVLMMNHALEIGAAHPFLAPCIYGSMVTPQPVQAASIFCPPHYFTNGSFPPP